MKKNPLTLVGVGLAAEDLADAGLVQVSVLLSGELGKLTNGAVGEPFFLPYPKMNEEAEPNVLNNLAPLLTGGLSILSEVTSRLPSKSDSTVGRLCSDDIPPSDLSSVDGAPPSDEVMVDPSLLDPSSGVP